MAWLQVQAIAKTSHQGLFLRLFDRVVNPDGVDAGDAGLHLALAVMNAWLVIGKTSRQIAPATPVAIDDRRRTITMARMRKVSQPVATETSYRRRQADNPSGLLPCGKKRRCLLMVLVQTVIGRGKERTPQRLILKLLDKMAVPVKTAVKALQRLPPGAPGFRRPVRQNTDTGQAGLPRASRDSQKPDRAIFANSATPP